ncbi:MAG: DNA translocase FtsK 4TM domain-containing protein, partial [Planctomycetota bacterium]
MTSILPSHPVARLVGAIVLACCASLLLLALFSYRPEQITGIGAVAHNLGGSAGAWASHALIGSFGAAAFVIPVIMLGYTVALLRGKILNDLPLRLTGAVLLIPALTGLLHLIGDGEMRAALLRHWDHVHLHGLGGRVGWLLCVEPGTAETAIDHPGGWLRRHAGTVGSAAALVLVLIGAICAMRLHLIHYGQRVLAAARKHHERTSASTRRSVTAGEASRPRPATSVFSDEPAVAEPPRPTTPAPESEPSTGTTTRRRKSTTALDTDDLLSRIRARRKDLADANGEPLAAVAASSATISDDENVDDDADDDQSCDNDSPSPAQEDASPHRGPSIDAAVISAAPAVPSTATKTAPRPAKAASKPAPAPAQPRPDASGDYRLPSLEMLGSIEKLPQHLHDAEVTMVSGEIEALFADHKINVKVVNANRGPVITQYELELLDSGKRVKKLESFHIELSMRLGTEGVRIVIPLPGRKTIGVEVPNEHKEAVVMRDLVEATDPGKYALPLIIGRDVFGNPIIDDLHKMPHLLIAGATGMGKSVCLNAIISSLLLFRGPDQVKFIMVDPKMVELAPYEGIPHLLAAPITDMSKAHAALEWACKTMDERFWAMKNAGARNIQAYNALGEDGIRKALERKKLDPDQINLPPHMDYIVMIIDEYADLMMVNKEVEKGIVRLCQKARACGIHVILATQRPSSDVVTGLIKGNMPARICFRVSDALNSRVVLDTNGAESLIGKGDLLYQANGAPAPARGQGVWVRDDELDAIIEHAREQGSPEYDDTIFTTGAAAIAAKEGGSGETGGKASNWA